ncbi:MAG: hypothetical protein ACFB10_15790 [Salibacteraceae bacterium]
METHSILSNDPVASKIEFECFNDPERLLTRLTEKPDLLVVDHTRNSPFDLQWLEQTKKHFSNQRILLLVPIDQLDVGIESLRYGVETYLLKTGNFAQKLTSKIENMLLREKLKRQHKTNRFAMSVIFSGLSALVLMMVVNIYIATI